MDADVNTVPATNITITETMGVYKVEYPLNHSVGTYVERYKSVSNGDNNIKTFDTVGNNEILSKLDEIINLINQGGAI